MATMTEDRALAILSEVKNLHGCNFKAVIRSAWESGHYGTTLKQWQADLQQIRNSHGPSWLSSARVTAMHGRQARRNGYLRNAKPTLLDQAQRLVKSIKADDFGAVRNILELMAQDHIDLENVIEAKG